jgi:hypothetical protein
MFGGQKVVFGAKMLACSKAKYAKSLLCPSDWRPDQASGGGQANNDGMSYQQ